MFSTLTKTSSKHHKWFQYTVTENKEIDSFRTFKEALKNSFYLCVKRSNFKSKRCKRNYFTDISVLQTNGISFGEEIVRK